MAQVVTADAYLLGIYKRWYTDEKFEQLLWRNSPVLKKVKKVRIGGKEYSFGMLYGRGGAVSGDYTVAVANSASSSRNAEALVPPGNVFSVFTITQKEKMAATGNQKAAFIPAMVNKMFSATEAARKTLAACLYGSGYGELGYTTGLVHQGDTVMTLNYDTIVKMDVGTKFEVSQTVLPTGTFVAGGPYTVTAIDGNDVTFTPAAPVGTFISGACIMLSGGRDAGGLPNMPVGLAGWVPAWYNRGAAGGQDLTDWGTYIGTTFMNINRSVATDRLAGGFVHRDSGNSEKYSTAITRGVAIARRSGAVPDMIILNDEDYLTIVGEFEADRNYWQSINTADKKSKNEVVKGISDMKFSQATTWIENIYDDPYCPKGTAYILDSSAFEFVGLSNVETPLNDGINGNDPGVQNVDGVSAPDDTYKLIIDDYLSIEPATATANGPGAQVSLAIYGNFALRNPAHAVVIKF